MPVLVEAGDVVRAIVKGSLPTTVKDGAGCILDSCFVEPLNVGVLHSTKLGSVGWGGSRTIGPIAATPGVWKLCGTEFIKWIRVDRG